MKDVHLLGVDQDGLRATLRNVEENGWGSQDLVDLEELFQITTKLKDGLRDPLIGTASEEQEDLRRAIKALQEEAKTWLQRRKDAKQIGSYKETSTLELNKKSITVSTSLKPYKNLDFIEDNEDLIDTLIDEERGGLVVNAVHESFCDAIRETDFIIRHPNSRVEAELVFTDAHAGAFFHRSTDQLYHIEINITGDIIDHILDDGEVSDDTHGVIVHELVHHFDDAHRRDQDTFELFNTFLDDIRTEALTSFAQNALPAEHYQPGLDEPVSDLQDILEPLPDDAEEYTVTNDELAEAITALQNANAHYTIGRRVLDILYHDHLSEDNDSQAERKAFLKKVRLYDERQLLKRYEAVREQHGLGQDKLAHILDLAIDQGKI